MWSRMERSCMIFFRFFMNFVSLCIKYVHGESMCTEYVREAPSPLSCIQFAIFTFLSFLTNLF
jgi:hypothetical protein